MSFLKRLYDIVFAVVFIVITSPIMLFAYVGIKLSSKGPAIYKAERIGRFGETFTLYKFRTMRLDSGNIQITTLKNDDRIFRFGRFLRNSKIDELPQLWNVLIGEMSVVGPRPEDKENADRLYRGKYIHILDVKPGLTSVASLYDYTHGELYDNVEDYEMDFVPQKLELELYYVKNNNIFYDVKLSLVTGVTIAGVIFGKKKFKKPVELQASHKEEILVGDVIK